MKALCIARQPIFDAQDDIVGYELLYRRDAEAATAECTSGADRTLSVILDSVFGFGLDRVTDGRLAFINLPEHLLLGGTLDFLDPERVVLELLESVRPTPEAVRACRELRERGFKLAIDDFVYTRETEPLLELCDIVKIDVLKCIDGLDETVGHSKELGLTLLAEKVENAEVRERCAALGFEYFQGFHLERPETCTRTHLPAESGAVVRTLNLLSDDNVPDQVVEEAFRTDPELTYELLNVANSEAFRSDPVLTYKLLRIVNSVGSGSHDPDSVIRRLVQLGREPLRRWMSLLLVTVRDDGYVDPDVVKSALVRGRMAERIAEDLQAAHVRRVPACDLLFQAGLFSRLERMMGLEMEHIMGELRMPPAVKGALLGGADLCADVLRAVCAFEDGDWPRASRLIEGVGGDAGLLQDQHMDAFAWATAWMSFHGRVAAA